MKAEFKPYVGGLTVQPVKCPVCGSKSAVYLWTDEHMNRVVMCEGSALDEDAPGLTHCLLDLPPNELYFATARQAVEAWNSYAALILRRQVQNLEVRSA